MAIFRCSKCAHLVELPTARVGSTMNCPQCGQLGPIHDTVTFIRKVLEKYYVYKTALERLRDGQPDTEQPLHTESSFLPPAPPLEGIPLAEQLAQEFQQGPLPVWFIAHRCQVRNNFRPGDNSNALDDAALEIGCNFDILKYVVEQIRYGQTRGHTSVNLNLSKLEPEKIQLITSFCHLLRDQALVGKYLYQTKGGVARLSLQNAPAIRAFFSGEWLEWFVTTQVATFCQQQGLPYAWGRKLTLSFGNREQHEADVFFLLNQQIPLYIACETGEFRQSLEKYASIQKRLGLDKAHFLVCVAGLGEEQSSDLNNTHGMSFINERELIRQVTLVAP